jgi:hypothetical protein
VLPGVDCFRAARIGDIGVSHTQLFADQPGALCLAAGFQTSTLLPAGWQTSLRVDGVRYVIGSGFAGLQMRLLPNHENQSTEPARYHLGDLADHFSGAGDARCDPAAHTIAPLELVQYLAPETRPSFPLFVANR